MAREIYIKWLEEAKNDYKAGITLHNAAIFNTAVFHFQQSVEKVLKAVLYYYDKQPWGHSIFELIKELIKIGKENYNDILSKAKEFDIHYTSTRYPDALPGISPSELYDEEISQKFMNRSNLIIKFVEKDIENAIEESKQIHKKENEK